MTCFHELTFLAASNWPFIWLMDLLRYVAAAGVVVAVLDVAPRAWLQARSVRIGTVAEGQALREFLRSMRTVVVFSLVGTSVLVAFHLGWNRFYLDVAQHGWVWLPISLGILIVLHDTWFYWTHRLLHHRRVFTRTHRVHHLSVAPTPWSAYSFSAAEALVQSMYLPLVLLVVPAHASVVLAWTLWMVLRNTMGHSGVELLPRAWVAGWWGRWCTTTLHHEMHHAYSRCNFGLYFTWWDRACKTEHPEYRARLARLGEPAAAHAEDANFACRP
jgi:Delta7-sterol 5-desaturase